MERGRRRPKEPLRCAASAACGVLSFAAFLGGSRLGVFNYPVPLLSSHLQTKHDGLVLCLPDPERGSPTSPTSNFDETPFGQSRDLVEWGERWRGGTEGADVHLFTTQSYYVILKQCWKTGPEVLSGRKSFVNIS